MQRKTRPQYMSLYTQAVVAELPWISHIARRSGYLRTRHRSGLQRDLQSDLNVDVQPEPPATIGSSDFSPPEAAGRTAPFLVWVERRCAGGWPFGSACVSQPLGSKAAAFATGGGFAIRFSSSSSSALAFASASALALSSSSANFLASASASAASSAFLWASCSAANFLASSFAFFWASTSSFFAASATSSFFFAASLLCFFSASSLRSSSSKAFCFAFSSASAAACLAACSFILSFMRLSMPVASRASPFSIACSAAFRDSSHFPSFSKAEATMTKPCAASGKISVACWASFSAALGLEPTTSRARMTKS
mmetsp:Transcript_5425/g.15147  ORF Transcript_5425/g.15147 Transcript_5425/m.15147 type:complete len:311 (+) Transcript_5425:72-1004(+)